MTVSAQHDKPAGEKPKQEEKGHGQPATGEKAEGKPAEGEKGHGQPEGQEVPGVNDAEMARWMEAATPGEHHDHLKPFVGNWTTKSRFRMAADQEWMESAGESSVKWIMGERFLVEEVRGDMGGMTFEGMGLSGYDNFRQEYWSTWMDSMATSYTASTGKCDETGKTFTYQGTMDDPGRNQKGVKYRIVKRLVDDKSVVMEMHSPGADGKEFLNFEITYARK